MALMAKINFKMETNRRKRRKETSKTKLLRKHVFDLGGTEEDYNLIKDIDDKVLPEDGHENVDAKEISDYITELGLKNYQGTTDSFNSQKNDSKLEGAIESQLLKKSISKNKIPKDKKHHAAQENSGAEKNNSISFERQTHQGKEEKTHKKKKKNKKKLQVNEITSSTSGLTVTPPKPFSENKSILKHKSRNYVLIKHNKGKWFDNEFRDDPTTFHQISNDKIQEFKSYSEHLMLKECELYKANQESRNRRSDFQWIKTVLSTGALGDKVAAMIVLIQESPVHHLKTLAQLIGMVNIKGKRECIKATDTLRDLFLSDLLPENRKLRYFEQHPFAELEILANGNDDAKDKRLLLWYFEDQLKKYYLTFINALDTMSRDTVEATKLKSVNAMYELLVSNPEQEQVLLSKLVNKLGDPKYKIACQGSMRLTQLIEQHPNMKTVVALEVERLLFRSNIAVRTQYYGICFLNQIMLSEEESELAGRLITIYFGFFKLCIKKSEVNTKLMSALLTGVNRAYPYAKVDTEKINEQINAIYKVVHTSNFPIGIQALLLIYHVLDSKQTISDRYYTALYRKLSDPEIKNSNRQAVFLNLLYKSLRKDESSHRIRAFIKRILQVCTYQTPSLICGLLFLISELVKDKKGILKLQSIAELNEDDDDEEHFVDVQEDNEETPAVTLLSTENTNEVTSLGINTEIKTSPSLNTGSSGSSWLHRQNLKGTCRIISYDPFHRNPKFCGAEYTCVWELLYLSHHYHPSVSLFAETLLKGNFIEYTGDPLQDFTLIRFLDRFVFRNPKKVSSNASILGRRKLYVPKGIKGIPVNSENYVNRKEENVPPDEKFFFQYYSTKERKPKKDDSDVDSDDAEEFLSKFVPNEGKTSNDLDFASDMMNQNKKKSKKASEEEPVPSDDEDIDFNEDDDFQDAFKEYNSDLEDLQNTSAFNEEEAEFSDQDNVNNWEKGTKQKKKKKFNEENPFEDSSFPVKKPKKINDINRDNLSQLFAAAEEFSEMIDDNVNTGLDTTTAEAFSTKDNADVKQLRWEQARDKWIRGVDWKTRKMRKNKGKPAFRKDTFSQKKSRKDFFKNSKTRKKR